MPLSTGIPHSGRWRRIRFGIGKKRVFVRAVWHGWIVRTFHGEVKQKTGKRHWRSLSDLSANLQVWVSQECINRRHGSDQEHQKAHYIKEGPKHKAQPSQSFLHNPCLGAQLVNITHPQSFIEAKEPVRQLLRAKVFRKHMGVKTLVSFRSPKKIC